MKRLIVLLTVIAIALFPFTTVYAIANPDEIAFGSGDIPLAKVFENVAEDGDMLFVAEQLIEYTVEPTDYTASEAFIFEILDTSGTSVLFSRSVDEWGNKPVSIYLSEAQVTAAALTSGTAYVLRIEGNPLIFASPTGNSVTFPLTDTSYIDQSIGAGSETPTDNALRNFCIRMARNIEDYDTPASDYIVTKQGYDYLTNDAVNIFIKGIPNLYNYCPILFQSGAENLGADAPESTGTYALTLTPLNKWGQLTADGLTNLGVFLGINQALAGSVVLLILSMVLAIYMYRKTQSGIAVLLMVSATPFVGGYLGLMPMALAFIFVIIIMILMGYYFVSRGAL